MGWEKVDTFHYFSIFVGRFFGIFRLVSIGIVIFRNVRVIVFAYIIIMPRSSYSSSPPI